MRTVKQYYYYYLFWDIWFDHLGLWLFLKLTSFPLDFCVSLLIYSIFTANNCSDGENYGKECNVNVC